MTASPISYDAAATASFGSPRSPLDVRPLPLKGMELRVETGRGRLCGSRAAL